MMPSSTRSDNLTPRGRCVRMLDQRQQRQDAALAVIVGAQDENDVFERHHQHQRPEDERDDAEDFGGCRAHGRWPLSATGKRIERAGADIAEDDAERRQRQK